MEEVLREGMPRRDGEHPGTVIEITTKRRDALRWIAKREPVDMFPRNGPSLALVKALVDDGMVEGLRPSRPIGLMKYRLTAAGHTAKVLRRPIVMSPPMVRALLEGRKTMTRRIIDPSAGPGSRWEHVEAGDLLWVREAYVEIDGRVYYTATDHPTDPTGRPLPAKSGRFMLRQYSRMTLRVTASRVEPVQAISEEDARREGCTDRHDFVRLWKNLHDPQAWAVNPDVAVMSFAVMRCNIAAVPVSEPG